jgi:hypothetical protein
MEPDRAGASPPGDLGPTPATPGDVPSLHHPADADARRRLARAGLPRLLVVAAGEPPPAPSDALEDWIRAPFRPGDGEARRAVLLRRYLARTGGLTIDAGGTLRVGGHRIAVVDLHRAVLLPLVNHLGRPVERRVVEAEYLAAGGRGLDTLETVLDSLRRQLAPAGLALHVLSGGGLLLECSFTEETPAGHVVETTTTEPDSLY